MCFKGTLTQLEVDPGGWLCSSRLITEQSKKLPFCTFAVAKLEGDASKVTEDDKSSPFLSGILTI